MARYSAKTRRIVLARDGGCVAYRLWPHVCKDVLGWVHPWNDLRPGVLTLDHVREAPMMGKEPESLPEHLVALCVWAHQTSTWATSNREVLRAYLEIAMKRKLLRSDWKDLRAMVFDPFRSLRATTAPDDLRPAETDDRPDRGRSPA